MQKKIVYAVLGVVFAALGYVGVLVYSVDEATVLAFDNYSEVVSGDARKDHWIPDFLPESAEDIHVIYDISPSFLRVEFIIDPNDQKDMLQGFELVTDRSKVEAAIDKLAEFKWSQQVEGELSVYKPDTMTDSQSIILIVNEERNVVWYSID